MFIKGTANWINYRTLADKVEEVDFHFGPYQGGPYLIPYDIALKALESAYENSVPYVMFRHGCSTSGPFKTTTRSIIRGLMRSKKSTPFIIKCKSIQHDTVFVAAIRPKKK